MGPLAPSSASATQIPNPFIKGEVVGQIDEKSQLFNDGRDAQKKVNTTLSCSLWTVYFLALKPILVVGLVYSFFMSLLQMIRGGSSEAVSRLLWSLVGMALFLMPTNRSISLYKGTIVESLAYTSGLGAGSKTCAALNGWVSDNVLTPSAPDSTP